MSFTRKCMEAGEIQKKRKLYRSHMQLQSARLEARGRGKGRKSLFRGLIIRFFEGSILPLLLRKFHLISKFFDVIAESPFKQLICIYEI